MNNANPQSGGNSAQSISDAQVARMIREELAAQRSTTEKTLQILSSNAEKQLHAVIQEETERLAKQFSEAQKKIRLADERESGLALRESNLRAKEASLAHSEKSLEGRAKAQEARFTVLQAAERRNLKESQELDAKTEEAGRMIALQLLAEKKITERHHRELQLSADLSAAQDNYKAEKEMLDFEKAADDAAMAAAMSRYAPDLEEKLQALSDEYAADVHDHDEAPIPKSQRKAPAKRNVAKSLKEQLPAKEAPEALPEV